MIEEGHVIFPRRGATFDFALQRPAQDDLLQDAPHRHADPDRREGAEEEVPGTQKAGAQDAREETYELGKALHQSMHGHSGDIGHHHTSSCHKELMLDWTEKQHTLDQVPQKHGDQSAGGDGREVGKELHRSEDHPGGRVSPVVVRVDAFPRLRWQILHQDQAKNDELHRQRQNGQADTPTDAPTLSQEILELIGIRFRLLHGQPCFTGKDHHQGHQAACQKGRTDLHDELKHRPGNLLINVRRGLLKEHVD
mmetsp:Transcript_8429/g.18877  ORF Transcript_8429/g.18877 Transcript_8429/m.18877 type:complete len:252 (-) Transcript_8429:79-834(-)